MTVEAAQEHERQASLTRGSVTLTLVRVLTIALGYALNVYLARHLGPAAFGLLAAVVTVLVWLELVVAEGLPMWVVRAFDHGTDAPLLPRTYLLGQLGVAVVLALTLVAAAPALARVFAQPDDALLFRVAALDIPVFALYNLFMGVMLGAQAYALQGGTSTAYSAMKLAATVLFVGAAGLSVLGAIMASILASVGGLAVAVGLLAFFFRGRRMLGAATTAEGRSGGAVGEAATGSALTAGLLIIQSLALSADLWLVKALLPSADAGYYRAASLIAQVPIALSASFAWAMYGAYAKAHRTRDVDRMGHYLRQSARLLIAAGALCIAIVVPTSESLLVTVFSKTYTSAAPLLALLVTGTAVGMIALALAPTLLIEGHGRTVLAVAGALVAIEVAAAFLLAPAIGATGAAASVTVAFVTATVLALTSVRKHFTVPIAGLLARLGSPAIVILLLARQVRPGPGPALLGWYGVFVALYALLLFVTGALTRDDLEGLQAAVARS